MRPFNGTFGVPAPTSEADLTNKINKIRAIRELFPNMSLKEAKDFVEAQLANALDNDIATITGVFQKMKNTGLDSYTLRNKVIGALNRAIPL